MHAQRELTILGMCVCYHLFCHCVQQCTQPDIPAALVGHKQNLKMVFLFKMLHSGVMAIFAYAAKSAIFCYTCEHVHTGTRPRSLLVTLTSSRSAFVPTCESTALW